MLPILFIDYNSPISYDLETLNTQAIGGTEATTIRIAEKLGEKVPVVIVQHHRKVITKTKNVTYSPPNPNILSASWQAIIVLRDPLLALIIRSQIKNPPIWIWMHDLINSNYIPFLKKIADNDIGFITISNYQQKQLTDLYDSDPYFPRELMRFKRIYNPIDDHLAPNETPVNPNKLMFISSHHKGLEYTLQAFQFIRKKHPDFELFITTPGYAMLPPHMLDFPNVKYLGPLNHTDNLEHLRSALCLFYLNHVYPETFGLVLAEANAIGTPVLTHPLGAAPEVLSDPLQLINTYDLEGVENRLMEWHSNRPKVVGREELRLSTICKQWEELLKI